MDRIANRQQTDTGPRHVLQGTCGDCRVQVVAGYDICQDRWLCTTSTFTGTMARQSGLPTARRDTPHTTCRRLSTAGWHWPFSD